MMFKKILVAIDLSTEDVNKKLCETANDLAEKFTAEIRLMSVLPDYGMPLVASCSNFSIISCLSFFCASSGK